MNNKGFINIHGKQYATVAHRLQEFRKRYPLAQIVTKLEKDEDNKVIFSASISIDQVIIATGWAEEVRGSSNINKTSALENCESSALGRALAFMGFGIDGSIASAEEVQNAINIQTVMEKKLTKQQEKAIESYLENQHNGVELLQRVLNKAKVDNLKELPKDTAEKMIKGWSIIV
tara:strand:- start:645 stop:1169 length:525 start_codon:yes stop_codon:yes gene_type:complete